MRNSLRRAAYLSICKNCVRSYSSPYHAVGFSLVACFGRLSEALLRHSMRRKLWHPFLGHNFYSYPRPKTAILKVSGFVFELSKSMPTYGDQELLAGDRSCFARHSIRIGSIWVACGACWTGCLNAPYHAAKRCWSAFPGVHVRGKISECFTPFDECEVVCGQNKHLKTPRWDSPSQSNGVNQRASLR